VTTRTTSPATVIGPIESVQIENFRGARDLTIQLDPQVTVFFGVNAAGKTTILRALAVGLGALVPEAYDMTAPSFLASDIRRPRKVRTHEPPMNTEDKDVPRQLDLLCLAEATTNPSDISVVGQMERYARVTIRCASCQWDVTKLRSVRDAPQRDSIGKESLNAILDPLMMEALDACPETAASQRLIPLVAAYGTERAVIDVPLRDRGFRRELFRLEAFDDSLCASTRFKTVFEWFWFAEDEERRDRERLGSRRYRSPSLEWVRKAIAQAEFRCSNPRIENKPIRMLVDFEHEDGHIEALDIASLSDGYRTHFALLIDIARRMVQLNPSDDLDAPDRGTNSEAIVLIDEIDLHLDPTWQATVVRGLRAAFPRAQFVLTTHSEQVIASVPAASVRKVVVEEGEVRVEGVPFAQGASGERILIELMGAKARVPGDVTRMLEKYLRLVENQEEEGEEAISLRSQLDEAIPRDELLFRADMSVRRRKIVARFKGKKP